MCGRFTRLYTWKQLHALLDLRYPENIEIKPSWNVAPTQTTPVCRLNKEGERELVPMRWGFTPEWSKEGKPGPINARSESIATSTMFRRAFASRRCIVPISGFYEWKAAPGGKQPHYIRLASNDTMLLAGIWERWGTGEAAVDTFAILTAAPNALVARIHDRMPVILEPDGVSQWLDASRPERAMPDPLAAERLEAFPVSSRVNSPRNNDPGLCVPCDPPAGLFDHRAHSADKP
ncbi:MAG: SOS response-associated peptidase [Phycisphaerae bacterium]|nr:SOS response-associated peptidase [Phycisphaerae bacterium]